MEEIDHEILDLLRMGPEDPAQLTDMLDDEMRALVGTTYGSPLEGVRVRLDHLRNEGLIRKSTKFEDTWELAASR